MRKCFYCQADILDGVNMCRACRERLLCGGCKLTEFKCLC